MKYLIVNFKTKKSGVGEKAIDLAKIANGLKAKAKKKGVEIILSVDAIDLFCVSQKANVSVYAQHVDPIEYGSHTGWILPEAVKLAKAKGTLLNHAEHRIDFRTLKKTLERCKEVGLKTCVCIPKIGDAKRVALLNPTFVAYEDPKLIGTKQSISLATPDSVKKFALAVKKANRKCIPLCGAGVNTKEDVAASLKLGTKGVLLCSSVVSAKNRIKAFNEVLEGF